MSAYKAEVVGLRHGTHVREAHGEGAALFEILGGFVFGHADDYLPVVILSGPGGHHHVRVVVLVPRGYHHARLGSGHKRMVRPEILPARHFFQ